MSCTSHVTIAAIACTFAGASLAEPTVVFSRGPGDLQGGIFRADAEKFGTFDTFCLEFKESLSFGTTFEYTIGDVIKYNGGTDPNPLDSETAFLYVQFRQESIRDILGKPGLSDDELANAVQLAMWNLEESRPTDNQDALALVDAATDAVDSGQWNGLGRVRVMNVWVPGHVNDPDYARQDVLVIIPLPSAAGLAGLGLLGLAAARRRLG